VSANYFFFVKNIQSLFIVGDLRQYSCILLYSCSNAPVTRVLEMQAILIEILENFEFSPPPGNIEIIQGPTGLMAPM
jgi:hypothetical protein